MEYVPKIPHWVEPMPSLIHVNLKVFTSHTILVFYRMKFNTSTLSKGKKGMKCYALEKWESTLNLCSCPWKRCRPSRKLLAKWFFIWIILSVSLVWSLTVMVPTRLSLSNVSERNPLQASSIFDKVKVSVVAGQWPSSTSIMFYLRVLPSGISRISCCCTTSYGALIRWYLFPIMVIPRVSVCSQPRTLISESNPPYNTLTFCFPISSAWSCYWSNYISLKPFDTLLSLLNIFDLSQVMNLIRNPSFYLNGAPLAILSWISSSVFPWEGYTPNTCV